MLSDIIIPWNKEDSVEKESLFKIMDFYNLKQHVLIQAQKQDNTIGSYQ